MEQPDVRE